MYKLIAISGTPGTGKSTLAKYLAKKMKYFRLDLSAYYPELSKGYNFKKHCYEINLEKLKSLVKKTKKNRDLIIDSHISHLLPRKEVNLCIIVTCSDLKKLQKRLQKRGYSPQKIRENLDAEIFQVCLMEAKEMKHKVIVVDSSPRIDKIRLLHKIRKSL